MKSARKIGYSVYAEFDAVSGPETIAAFAASGKKFTDRPLFRAKDKSGEVNIETVVLGALLGSMGWIPPTKIIELSPLPFVILEIVHADHSFEPDYVARHIAKYDLTDTVHIATQWMSNGVYPSPSANAPDLPQRKHIERFATAQAFLTAVENQGGLIHVPDEEPRSPVGKLLRHLNIA